MTDTPVTKAPPGAGYRLGKTLGRVLPFVAVIIGFVVALQVAGDSDHVELIAFSVAGLIGLSCIAFVYLIYGSAAVGEFFDGFGEGVGDGDGDGGGDGGD